MKGFGMTTVGLVLFALLAWAAPAAANEWKITGLSVKPDPTIKNEFNQMTYMDNDKLTVKCSYNGAYMYYPDGYTHQLFISDNGVVKDGTGITGTDTRETTYNIQGGGNHAIKCSVGVTPPKSTQPKIVAEKTLIVVVAAKKPAVGGGWPQSPDEKEVACLPTVPVWLELDAASVKSAQEMAKVVSTKEKHKADFPITESKALFKTVVTCVFVMGKVSVYYSFACKDGRPAGKPHHYFCKK